MVWYLSTGTTLLSLNRYIKNIDCNLNDSINYLGNTVFERKVKSKSRGIVRVSDHGTYI